MDLIVFENTDKMCGSIVTEIADVLRKNPSALFCIASGHTSLSLFETLVRLYDKNEIDFKDASIIAMDEWLGMSVKTPDSCGDFISKNFINKVNFKPENVRLFDGTAANCVIECRSAEQFIYDKSKHGAIDFLVMGAGMNGHIALNEPGCDLNAGVRVVELDDTTRKVGQKYFTESTTLTGGITLGVENFKNARRSILMVCGAHKKEILQKIINEPVSNAVPATVVREFENASLYCDEEAYMKGEM